MKLKKSKIIINTARILFDIFFFLVYRYEVHGKEKIPPEGNAVIVMKHQSWVDTMVAATLPPRSAYFMAKYEIFDNLFCDFPGTILFTIGKAIAPFTNWLLFKLGVLPIDRDNPARLLSSFKYMKKLLQEGEYLIFYPEGRVIRDKMGEFKSGLVKMIQRFQKKASKKIKFVPVGISYEKKRFFRKKIVVKIGDPMEFEWNRENATEDLKETIEGLTDFNL